MLYLTENFHEMSDMTISPQTMMLPEVPDAAASPPCAAPGRALSQGFPLPGPGLPTAGYVKKNSGMYRERKYVPMKEMEWRNARYEKAKEEIVKLKVERVRLNRLRDSVGALLEARGAAETARRLEQVRRDHKAAVKAAAKGGAK